MNTDVLRRLKATEIKLKSVAGYTFVDRQRDEIIKEELGVSSLTDRIEDLHDHNYRMDVDKITLRTLKYVYSQTISSDGLYRHNLEPEQAIIV